MLGSAMLIFVLEPRVIVNISVVVS